MTVLDDVPSAVLRFAWGREDGVPELVWANRAAGELAGVPADTAVREGTALSRAAAGVLARLGPVVEPTLVDLHVGEEGRREHLTAVVRPAPRGAAVVVPTPSGTPAPARALDDPQRTLEQIQTWGQVGFWELELGDPRHLYWSTQLFEIFGLDQPGLAGFLDRVHPDDRVLLDHVVERAQEQAGPYRVEHRFLRGDEERHLSHRIQSIPGPDDGPTRLLGVVTDVTQLRTLEAEVGAAGVARNAGVVASSLMHDFKNQLVVVQGHATMLLAAHERGEPVDRESLDAVLRAANRGIELTRDVLGLGRPAGQGAEQVDPGPFIRRVADLARPAFGASTELAVDIDEPTELVLADPSRLEHAVMDLLLNAADAMRDATGTVTVRYRELILVAADEAGRGGLASGEYCVISVVDAGSGMDDETRRHASDPYFSTKGRTQGSGIGLAAVRSFVEGLGGALRIDSELGRGSTIEMRLPIVRRGVPSRRRRGAVRVLVFLGDEHRRRQVTSVLRAEGVQSVLVADEREVERFLRTEPIDAVVLDAVDTHRFPAHKHGTRLVGVADDFAEADASALRRALGDLRSPPG